MGYKSISIMEGKREEQVVWVVILGGNTDNPKDVRVEEFNTFDEVKVFINSLQL